MKYQVGDYVSINYHKTGTIYKVVAQHKRAHNTIPGILTGFGPWYRLTVVGGGGLYVANETDLELVPKLLGMVKDV